MSSTPPPPLFGPPAETRLPNCANCGEPVQWVTTERGTVLMLDLLPSSAGKVAIVRDPSGASIAVLAIATRPPPPAAGVLYTHHLTTCRKRDKRDKR
jgi:hypothetical protein